MKKLLLVPILGFATVLTFASCTTVEEHHPAVTSTTTEEQTIHRQPIGAAATTETRTVRSY